LATGRPGGSVTSAQSLQRLNGTQETCNRLSSGAHRFSDYHWVLYHLAVSGCHLHKLPRHGSAEGLQDKTTLPTVQAALRMVYAPVVTFINKTALKSSGTWWV